MLVFSTCVQRSNLKLPLPTNACALCDANTQQILDFARNTISEFSANDGAGLLYVLSRLLGSVRTRADDVANWPSPFTGLKAGVFQDSGANWLELIDGSSNGENVPYAPLFVKARALDVIVTAEGSADIPGLNWPKYVLLYQYCLKVMD